jgi:hypothetical protein
MNHRFKKKKDEVETVLRFFITLIVQPLTNEEQDPALNPNQIPVLSLFLTTTYFLLHVTPNKLITPNWHVRVRQSVAARREDGAQPRGIWMIGPVCPQRSNRRRDW